MEGRFALGEQGWEGEVDVEERGKEKGRGKQEQGRYLTRYYQSIKLNCISTKVLWIITRNKLEARRDFSPK